MPGSEHFIAIHPAAPAKPALGAPCNGCGVCCAAEPCPVSRFLLGHRTGACPALQWHEPEQRYVCGMAIMPAVHLRWLPLRLEAPLSRLSLRWIAAGSGCDFQADVSAAEFD